MEALKFSRSDVEELAAHFEAIAEKVPLHPITTERDYDFAVRALNALLDAGAADEGHRLAPLADALGEFVGDYDQAHYQLPEAAPVDVLKYLMMQNDVKQSAYRRSREGVVSEILSGKRELNTRQIAALSKRFRVSPAVFFSD
jgi:HTH-type transcriptional regulator / antitoxin HigA